MSIEYLSLLVSILSAIMAIVAILRSNEANRIAAESNKITKHYNLRPMRLDAFNLMRDFAEYCTKYRTMFLQEMVSGTGELMDRRDSFLSAFQAFGPLGMPEVEEKMVELSNKAVQLQRLLDRSKSNDPKPLDSQYASPEDNIDAVVDWFAEEKNSLPSLFNKYIEDA